MPNRIEPLLARELRGGEDGVTIRFGTSRGEPGSAKNTTTSTDTLISSSAHARGGREDIGTDAEQGPQTVAPSRVGGSCGGVDPSAAPLNVVGSPAGLIRLSGDEGTTEGAQLEAAIGWDRGGETR